MEKTVGSKRQRDLAIFLAEKREASGMTQAQFAKKISEYQSFVARLESGQRRIDVVEFEYFAKVLSFDPREYFDT